MATANMGLTKPTEGGSNGSWDTVLNTLIDLLDAHDHSTGKGVKVDQNGLLLDGDWALSTQRLTGGKSLGFTSVASGELADSGSYLLTLGVIANELYWVTSGGTEVKLTDGSGLNMSLAGGITGDYTTTDADCEYSDSLKAFAFLQDETPDHYADIRCGDLQLFETTSGITSAVTLKSPDSLAASYDVVFPAALPAATSLVTLGTSGDLAATITPTGLTSIGVVTVNAQNVNATSAATIEELTVVNPVLHGELTLQLSVLGGLVSGFSHAAEADNHLVSANAADYIIVPIPLGVGERIVSYRASADPNNDQLDIDLYRGWGGTRDTKIHDLEMSDATWAVGSATSVNETILANKGYFFLVSAAIAGQEIDVITVVYDRQT